MSTVTAVVPHPPLRLVIDTNVVVSALLHPGRAPDRCLAAVLAGGHVVLWDARIAAEYRAVLARPRFHRIDPLRTAALLEALFSHGTDLGEVPSWAGAMTDPDDRAFVEVARAGRADVLVTGNGRHYPTDAGFDVLGPSALLVRLDGG